LSRVRQLKLEAVAIRANAERFSRARFLADFRSAVADAVAAAAVESAHAHGPRPEPPR
jgi:hypothetical protein